MFGIGKPRTKFGKWIDRSGITQEQVREWCGVTKNMMTLLCSDLDYDPSEKSRVKIIGGLRKRGYDVSMSDFWE